MSEFTGERVVPGQVDSDLFNEHMARYRFAARYSRGMPWPPKILDVGCGTGYGTATLKYSMSVTGLDISQEAIDYAKERYFDMSLRFEQGDCTSLRFADGSIDLICAFEVIEHLERWPEFLKEALRVLSPQGVLLVSTPNKNYYAEARAKAGPNPFHCHEFEYEEYERELSSVFAHVRLWTQNHNSAIVFAPVKPAFTDLDAEADNNPGRAHFFLAACSREPISRNELYAWMPDSGNLLGERERHIAKLEEELAEKDRWLEKRAREHAALHQANQQTQAELEESNRWAFQLRQDLQKAEARVLELQDETAERLAWVNQLDAQIAELRTEIARLNSHREQLEAELAARAEWGFGLDAQVRALDASLVEAAESLSAMTVARDEMSDRVNQLVEERRLASESKWMRLGRRLNLGPQLE